MVIPGVCTQYRTDEQVTCADIVSNNLSEKICLLLKNDKNDCENKSNKVMHTIIGRARGDCPLKKNSPRTFVVSVSKSLHKIYSTFIFGSKI